MRPGLEKPRFGQSVRRREDPSLITGDGSYTDNLTRPRMVYAGVKRSPHARARVESVDRSGVEEMSEVVGVFTARDLDESDIPGNLPAGKTIPGAGVTIPSHPLLADREVHYQGEPVAVVVATDRYVLADALEELEVRYEPEEPVLDPEQALEAEAPSVHDDVPDNRSFEWEAGNEEDVDRLFEEADVVVELEAEQKRLIPNAMEPRVALADYRPGNDKLNLTMGSQSPHHFRALVSMVLGLPEQRIRVQAPDVGGGFGSKDNHYAEEILACWCSMTLDRPVKWTARRTETYVSDVHGRAHRTRGQLAARQDGTILAVRAETVADLGAYVGKYAPSITTDSYTSVLSGQYDIEALHARVTGVFTNRVPADAYRGAGQPEGCFLLERLVDRAARELELDPAEMRRTNFIAPDQFPYRTAHGIHYDSGDYEHTFDRALDLAEYDAFRQRQESERNNGRYLGLGLSCWIKSAAAGPARFTYPGTLPSFIESGAIRVHPSGTITAYCGTSGHGQGHETSFAQLLSERLQVPMDDIEIVESDTDQVPQGTGTFASRSMAIGGGALASGADRILEKARTIAAHLLEASEGDVELDEGEFRVAGAPSRSLTWADVAREAYRGHRLPEGMEPGLTIESFYDPENFTFPFGTHVVLVEVNPPSGEVEVLNYVAVDDCGRQINPMLVEGQVHGAVAQGLGQALYEEAVYDDQGNLSSGSMMDYVVPKTVQLPDLTTDSTVTPCPHNPLGVKGIGEAGCVAAPPAVINAIVDALAPFGVDHVEMPASPNNLWQVIQPDEE